MVASSTPKGTAMQNASTASIAVGTRCLNRMCELAMKCAATADGGGRMTSDTLKASTDSSQTSRTPLAAANGSTTY